MREGDVAAPKASVIIPTWNGLELLCATLESLETQTLRAFEVIVVDNGSTDGTVERLAPIFPRVRWIRLEENRGFAAAVNVGIRASRAEIVALLNNDAVADPGWLGALVDALERYPHAGSAASRMLRFDDRTRIDSAGVQLGLYGSQIGEGEENGEEFNQEREVFAACAGAAAYRKAALHEVGLFDERYFAYFEDVDIGARLQLAGYRCVYVPAAVVYHHGSATGQRIPDRKFFLLMRNSLFVFFQFMPLRRMVVWAPVVLIWPFVRALLDGRPIRLAAHALLAFVRDLRAVVKRRRQVRLYRRISWKEFQGRLANPLTRSERPGPWSLRGPGGARSVA